ncbi:MAG: hypothetical protein H5T69_15220, partial [Chloroflexi bacterium]|nr:hypothetical protein [Chloroflexota bacterium]
TKVFDPSETLVLILAVDVQTAPHTYESVPEYLELAMAAAASLAAKALDERHMVGLLVNCLNTRGGRSLAVTPGRHPQQLAHLLETLAGVTAFRGMPFHEMLWAMVPSLPRRATVVAISARVGAETIASLATLKRLGHQVLLLTIGEQAPAPNAEISMHHLGGIDVWREMAGKDEA